MEAIKANQIVHDVLSIILDDDTEYYPAADADAKIAKLTSERDQAIRELGQLGKELGACQHKVDVLNEDLTRCQEAKAKYCDKIIGLEVEVERLKEEIRTAKKKEMMTWDDGFGQPGN